jgi:hypothetical protein
MSVPPHKKLAPVVPPNGSVSICCWLYYWERAPRSDSEELTRELARIRVDPEPLNRNLPNGAGVCVFSEPTQELRDFLRTVSCGGRERVIAVAGQGGLVDGICYWDLLQAGASDVLIWSTPDRVARQVRNRLERWLSVDQLIEAPSVADFVVGKSAVWRAMLRSIVEIARFSDAPALILGESGTGKEIVAQLFHLLDPRPTKPNLIVLDCSTIVPELSGSEFFGHERDPGQGAIGKDCCQLHANHEARADHGGDDLSAEPRVLGSDCAEEPDCQHDCNRNCGHR